MNTDKNGYALFMNSSVHNLVLTTELSCWRDCSGEGLMLKMSASSLFTAANLHFQLSC